MMNGEYLPPFQQAPLRHLQPNYSHQRLIQMLEDDTYNRGLGCLFGSFIGDALGAYLEFQKEGTFQRMANQVMEMKGGGVFKLKPGQVTDDSEMSFHLLTALSLFQPQRTLEQQRRRLVVSAASQYSRWYDLRPFDMGHTTKAAIKTIRQHLPGLEGEQLEQKMNNMYAQINEANKESQSNGSLMRITPLPFLGSLIMHPSKGYKSSAIIESWHQLVKDEVKLTHTNPVALRASQTWSSLLLELIVRSPQRPLAHIYAYICKQTSNKYGMSLLDWVQLAHSEEHINAREKIGWGRIAWCTGIRLLHRLSQLTQDQLLSKGLFERQIDKVLKMGGDTDTNAAIVGGMLGAVVGFKRLPVELLSKLMKLQHPEKRGKHPDRPQQYEPRRAFLRAYRMIITFEKYWEECL